MAKDILKLIEEVDLSDTAKLDEIDARVWCFVKKRAFPGLKLLNYENDLYEQMGGRRIRTPKYTRSRDALKKIRPEGWWFQLIPCASGNWMCDSMHDIHVEPRPTEELAELHAIIQAIAYERGD